MDSLECDELGELLTNDLAGVSVGKLLADLVCVLSGWVDRAGWFRLTETPKKVPLDVGKLGFATGKKVEREIAKLGVIRDVGGYLSPGSREVIIA